MVLIVLRRAYENTDLLINDILLSRHRGHKNKSIFLQKIPYCNFFIGFKLLKLS